jgi:hypothetical protein
VQTFIDRLRTAASFFLNGDKIATGETKGCP